MLRTYRSKIDSVFAPSLVAVVVTALLHTAVAYAQITDESEDAALVAAERALLEGLSSKGPSAFLQPDAGNAVASQAELKPATYQLPVIKPEQIRNEILEKSPPPGINGSVAKGMAQSAAAERKVRKDKQPVAPSPNAALKRELEASHRRIAELERKLEETRGQLTMAETELSRLATISEARTRTSFGQAALPALAQPSSFVAPAAAKSRIEAPAIEPTPASSAALTIATVEVAKAELRLGPGKNHSALMSVAKGSRLAVEARQGEWLRVFAPNGQRAWVHSKLVTFGSKERAKSTTTTVRVHGYSSSLEDEAFKRVQSLTARR